MSIRGKRVSKLSYPKCRQCGGVAFAGGCPECQYWYCNDHIHRHNNCSEGR